MKHGIFTKFLKTMFFASLFWLAAPMVVAQSYDTEAYQMLKDDPAAFKAMMASSPNLSINLRKADLSGLDLSGIRFSNCDLSYTNLTGANLKEANLTNTNLIGAKLMNTNFHRSDLSYANLNKTNATGANFADAVMKNTVTEYLMIQEGHQLNPAFINSAGQVQPISK